LAGLPAALEEPSVVIPDYDPRESRIDVAFEYLFDRDFADHTFEVKLENQMVRVVLEVICRTPDAEIVCQVRGPIESGELKCQEVLEVVGQ
jgi:hypothetical protein